MTGRMRGWARGSWMRGGAALLALVAGVQASPAFAQFSCGSVYAINGADGDVYLTANNGTQSYVATLSGAGAVNAFGIGSGGTRAYVATSGSSGGQVTVYSMSGSTATALSTSGTPTLQSGMGGFNSGAVNPANGLLYLAGASTNAPSATSWQLYVFNPATPSAAPVRVAQITGTTGNNGDIAFDSAGNLYLLSGNADNTPANHIYRIGQVPTSGVQTLPASIVAQVAAGSGAGNVGGIAFNAAGEIMTSMQSGGNVIRRYNPLTGAQISTGTASAGAVSDLASCASPNTITLRKDLPGGRFATNDQFTLQLSGGSSGSVTTSGTASGLQAAVVGPLLGGVDGQSFTINEVASGGANLANYRRSWQCVDAANGNASVGSGTTFPGTLNIPSTTGPSDVVCTITNAVPPRVTIRKISVGGTGAFSFTGTNGIGSQTLTTTTAGTAVSGTTQELTTAGVATTITESAPPTGYTLTAASCTGLPSGGDATLNAATRTLTLNAAATAAGANLTCTFTNTRGTSLTLVKTVTNDHGGAQPASAWTLSAAGPTSISGATGSAAVTNATVTPGTYTLSESATPTGYIASLYSCVRNGGAAVVGNSITLAAGDTVICTINNNDSNETDLSIEKSASPGQVVSGSQVTFTLIVRNLGVAAAHGAVVRDPAMAGLDCVASGLPAPTCSATGSATCPSPLTASGLQAGAAIPTFPNGGVVTIGLTCRVTASGVP